MDPVSATSEAPASLPARPRQVRDPALSINARALCRKHRGAAVDVLLEIMNNAKGSSRDRMSAAVWVLLFADGRPRQQVEVMSRGMTERQLEDRLLALMRRADLRRRGLDPPPDVTDVDATPSQRLAFEVEGNRPPVPVEAIQ